MDMGVKHVHGTTTDAKIGVTSGTMLKFDPDPNLFNKTLNKASVESTLVTLLFDE